MSTLLSIEHPVALRIRVGDVWTLTLDDTDGRGFVSLVCWPCDFAASYYWPRTSRATPSLLAFLLGTDISYVANKFRCNDDFDDERATKAANEWLDTYKEDLDDPDDLDALRRAADSLTTQSEWEGWARDCAAAGLHGAWEIGMPTQIEPAFRRFYDSAWPLLRERRAEIEAVLYPNGVPERAKAAS
jgi:hypothetical protein